MQVSFTVLGEPRGKGRPRATVRGGFAKVYTPNDTVVYENLIRVEYERQCGGAFFDKGRPVEMDIVAVYGIPRSASKKKVAMMQSGEIRPLKKVDSSNLLKAVEDSLNGVAYHDDVQIVETHVSRFYGENPRVVVTIKDVETITRKEQ